MTDIKQPLYYRSTGRPVEIVDIEPVVRYKLRAPGGSEVWMTQAEFDEQVTNTKPHYQFDQYTGPRSGLRVRSLNKSFLRINMASRFGAGRAQTDIDADDAAILHRNLGRWLADRQPPAVVNEMGAVPTPPPSGDAGVGSELWRER